MSGTLPPVEEWPDYSSQPLGADPMKMNINAPYNKVTGNQRGYSEPLEIITVEAYTQQNRVICAGSSSQHASAGRLPRPLGSSMPECIVASRPSQWYSSHFSALAPLPSSSGYTGTLSTSRTLLTPSSVISRKVFYPTS